MRNVLRVGGDVKARRPRVRELVQRGGLPTEEVRTRAGTDTRAMGHPIIYEWGKRGFRVS